MEEERTIMGYSAIVDEGRVGIGADAYIAANVSPDKDEEAITGLLGIENVTEVLHTTGERLVMFRISAESDKDLLNILDKRVRPLGLTDLDILYVLDHVVRYPGL
jgi:DNA-binding Lrp family transcriptional regulator